MHLDHVKRVQHKSSVTMALLADPRVIVSHARFESQPRLSADPDIKKCMLMHDKRMMAFHETHRVYVTPVVISSYNRVKEDQANETCRRLGRMLGRNNTRRSDEEEEQDHRR